MPINRLLLLLFLAWPTTLVAQEQSAPSDFERRTFEFGIRGGINLASFNGDDETIIFINRIERIFTDSTIEIEDDTILVTPSTRVVPRGGLFVTWNFHPLFALQIEGSLVQRGANYQTTAVAGLNYNLTYIDVPILAKFKIPSRGDTKPSVYIGPVFSWLIDQDRSFTDGKAPVFIDSLPPPDVVRVREQETGLIIGAALDLFIGRQHFSLDARYQLMFDDWLDDPMRSLNSRNRAFGVLLGYYLR